MFSSCVFLCYYQLDTAIQEFLNSTTTAYALVSLFSWSFSIILLTF
jgi:hypothetical protein